MRRDFVRAAVPKFKKCHRGATKFENTEYWTRVVLPRKQKQRKNEERKLEEQETEFVEQFWTELHAKAWNSTPRNPSQDLSMMRQIFSRKRFATIQQVHRIK
ncbi:hypothetical protein PIB30_078491 [Stylosanthes scabra]|uniref:Uncharacterized protein n=1 Tax=Stylosanthes scabra TaxID=79078 RepID=A0ABU6QS12_9FABA|nr:hypothetical protein [Stylosanthes scabra]